MKVIKFNHSKIQILLLTSSLSEKYIYEKRNLTVKGYEKYDIAYFMPPECTYDWVKKDHIDKAPIWCSVDLRDGN